MSEDAMPAHLALTDLKRICAGTVLAPHEDGFADTCAGWNLAWTQNPAIVVQAANEADVVNTVKYADKHGLAVAVQTTGHGVTIAADHNCIMVTTKRLNHVQIDPDTATATMGGGVTWESVLSEAQRHGLAPLLGSAPHVGAVGFSLGGGLGWLARQHGLGVDAVRSLRVVLADGTVVTASPHQSADLFWAMCGTAGSAFGIVTEIVVGLASVGDVYAGSLLYPVATAREVFEFYRSWSADAPQPMSSAFNITAFPDLDIVPQPLRGTTFAIVRGCYCGTDLGTGEKLVDTWRRWRTPAMDMWTVMPFARSAEISMDPVDPMPALSSGRWLKTLDSEVLDAMLDLVVNGDGSALFVEARHAGGAVSQANPQVSYAGRDGAYSLEAVSIVPDPAMKPQLHQRNASLWQRLHQKLASTPSYLNFVEGEERVHAVDNAFDRHTLSRLAGLKRRYDPANMFRYGAQLSGRG